MFEKHWILDFEAHKSQYTTTRISNTGMIPGPAPVARPSPPAPQPRPRRSLCRCCARGPTRPDGGHFVADPESLQKLLEKPL